MLPTWLSFPLLLPYRINIGSLSSLVPYSANGPFKRTLIALFRLAWSNKLQLPILITCVFMACDIRLQLEINIFWEANHPNGRNRQANVNAQAVVPNIEIPANGGDDNSENDSEEEDTDSDETELQSLKDNNDSDTDDEGEHERPNPQSRFFSDSDHNFSDRNSNEDNGDSDSGNGNPPIFVELEIHRADTSTDNHSELKYGFSEEIDVLYRHLHSNIRVNGSEINILNLERRQTAYKAFAKTTNVTKRVLLVPLPFKAKNLPNNANAQNCFKRTDFNGLRNPANSFSLSNCTSNFLSSIRSAT